MEFENLLKLIECVSKSKVDSFCYEEGGTKIRMKKSGEKVQVTAPAAPASGKEESSEVEAGTAVVEGRQVKSPLVGIFYAAPAEDAPPFVAVGDTVRKGQTLGIVEAMKLMNEIECECDGVVKEIPVKNGDAVEYGQTLFVITPASGGTGGSDETFGY
ncbi:acetyl-CoA carboxylase biotin carboxyl carrier protein [Lachnospiraceae bacterium 46-15]